MSLSYSDLLHADWSRLPGDVVDSIAPYLSAREVLDLCLRNDTFNRRVCYTALTESPGPIGPGDCGTENEDSIVWKLLYQRDISHNVPRDHIASQYLDIMDHILLLTPGYRLNYGARKGYDEIVRSALQDGADIHTWDDFALRVAAEKGHTETVKLLLERGAKIHVLDDAPLRFAARSGHTGTVKLLLEHGATIVPYIKRIAEDRGNPEILSLLT